jgi:hypothetical protein
MPAPPGSAGRLCDPAVAPAVLGYAHLLPPTTMQFRRVELPLHTRALEVRSSSFDEAAGTIEVIWGSGARVKRAGYNGRGQPF